ncbi:hypothetical protein [Tenacibaculum sp. nBUS_03]|uniref:hypothetical protein n=1 Tax=Tenacibaculum sp. nBUS_03 TaxID=3395320 RepID=UPI003EBF324A
MLLVINTINSQIDANSVKGLPIVSNDIEMNGITGASDGSLVYNTNQKNIYIYDGTSWVSVNKPTINLGEIKYSVLATDHSGWYLLDGRAINTLSANAQTNANNLGFTTNIPNSQNRILKGPSTGENIADTGGLGSTTLVQANLPNVNFNGTTSTNGNHTHTMNRLAGNDQIRNGSDANRTFYNQGANTNTSTAGNHTHTFTVNSGGTNQSFDRYQPYLVVNTFIYLGL